ncbi:MAG: potassium transporter TrkG [Pseudomonadota bacterium]
MPFAISAYILGWLLALFALGHAVPILVALQFAEGAALQGFVESFAITAFAAGALLLAFRGRAIPDGRRILLICLISVLVATPAAAGLPLLTGGMVSSFIEAYFEGASAITATGASLLGPHDLMTRSGLVWRIMCEWFGGLIVLIAAAVVLPLLGTAAIQFGANALPHGEGAGVMARIRLAFHLLGRAYALLTLGLALALWLADLPFLDGLTLAMTAMATGGFTLRDAGLGHYANPLAELIVLLGLLLGALNLTLVRAAVRGRPALLWHDQETRTFAKTAFIGAAILMTFWLIEQPGGLAGEAGLWSPFFLALSTLATSGLTTGQTVGLPLSIGIILLSLAMLGGSVMSTTGGVKMLRVHLIGRFAGKELARLSHPHGVFPVRLRGRRVDIATMTGVWALLLGSVLLIVFGTLFFAAFKLPFLAALASAVAMLTGAGPLIPLVDPSFAGFGALSAPVLWVSAALMIAGRLEVILAIVPLARLFRRLA